MKIKRLNIKKACLVLGTSFVLVSAYKYEHHYKPNYEIVNVDDGPFASYSDGYIYIGNQKYLDSLKKVVTENDILVLDERNSEDNPNMKIYSSYRINDKDVRNEILEVLLKYEEMYPSNWDRTLETMRLEWLAHNMSYYFNYKLDHSTDVDLDNNEQQMYEDVKILNKLLKL